MSEKIKNFADIKEALAKGAKESSEISRSREMLETGEHPYFDQALQLLGSKGLAEAVGYSRSGIQNIINGHRGVLKTLEVACRAVVMERGAPAAQPETRLYYFFGDDQDAKVQALRVTAQSLGIRLKTIERS